jgi:hypothetical protein
MWRNYPVPGKMGSPSLSTFLLFFRKNLRGNPEIKMFFATQIYHSAALR